MEMIHLGKTEIETAQAAKQEDEAKSGKKEKKAILFDFKGARKLNAETIVQRPEDLKVLRRAIQAFSDVSKFRIPDVKPVHSWSCSWGAREDGMLCVGINKHGYGAWVPIRDDPELGMRDKFFLEEHRVEKKEARENGNAKSPGAVHLVRRAEYLLGILRERIASQLPELASRKAPDAGKKARKNGTRASNLNSVSASPTPRSLKGKAKQNGKVEKPSRLEKPSRPGKTSRSAKSTDMDKRPVVKKQHREKHHDENVERHKKKAKLAVEGQDEAEEMEAIEAAKVINPSIYSINALTNVLTEEATTGPQDPARTQGLEGCSVPYTS